jgi:catechol 2,3-dioxygenase-like lactoylglutathione lyase family enzyme
MIRIDHLDHLVLTVASIPRTIAFYTEVLGMQEQVFDGGRRALRFGSQKINLHEAGHEFEPKAGSPQPGSADLCFILADPLETVVAALLRAGITPQAPGERAGASGAIRSIYIRDPDNNLIELAEPAGHGAGRQVMVEKTKIGSAAIGATAVGAGAIGATAISALAIGAAAIGALAIGSLAAKRVDIGRARIRRLEIDELVVRSDDPGGRAEAPGAQRAPR